MNSIEFIDVSGVGNSGKSAIVDLLRETEGVYSPEYWFEFDILRVPDGIIDLRNHLVTDWSPIRSHAAILAFRNVIRKMGRDPSRWNLPGLLDSTSQRYDRRFKGRFTELSEAFVQSFIIASYKAEWPYDSLREKDVVRFMRKIISRLGFRKQLVREVLLAKGQDFDVRVTAYMEELYRVILPVGTDRVVLNNGFEPFNPVLGLDMLAGSKQMVTTRDPRDVYVSGLNAHNAKGGDISLLAFDNDGMSKSFLATDDLEVFVKRYRLYRDNLYRGTDPRVLQIRFEDLILDHKKWVPKIFEFLGVPITSHVRPGSYFVPARSTKNIGIWKQYSRKEEIKYIEEQLTEYLVND